MNELKRTIIFAAVAMLVVSAAGAAHYLSRPRVKQGFERLGSEFYPDFKDPSRAARLHVEMYNEETSVINTFEVAQVDGVWRIPSRYNYPVDGKDRLAKTAASLIGVTRTALASRREGDFERYGVINPMDENSASLKGRGHRIILYGSNNEVLADYIIGKKAPGEPEMYFVRSPNEKEVYRKKLKIDLSTRFADWIEPDLLKIDRGDLREIVVNKYTIDRERGRLVGRETSRLSRKSFSDKWALDGLKEETEEVNADAVNDMVGDLDNLRIVGVRPKPAGLNPDLTLDRKVIRDQLAAESLGRNMAAYGFFVGEDNGVSKLFSNEGEVVAATDKGVVYHLNFGKVFVGTDDEMEFGAAQDGDKKDDADTKAGDDAQQEAADAKDAAHASESKAETDAAAKEADKAGEAAKADAEKKDSKLKNGRYVFVNVLFDESRIAPAPQKPVEPTKPDAEAKPEGETQPETPQKSEEEKKSEPPAAGAEKSDAPPVGDANNADEKKADAPAADPAKSDAKQDEKKSTDARSQYDEAMKKYQADLAKYELDLKDHQKKVEDGRKNVEELSKRFAGWYYVISAESFENLRLARSELVKPKEEKKDGAAPSTPPGIPGLPIPGDEPK